MGRTNSTFLFGPTRYVVGPDAGASYSTIASAVTAVAAAGSPATIYIQPGTYSESISWPSNVTVEAAANLISGTFCSPTVTIIGNQTFTGTGSIFLQAIKFVAIAGNVWTIGNAAGNCASFKDCQISSAILSGRGIAITGSGAGDCVLDLQDSLIGTADDCVYASYTDISVARCNLNCLNASKANLNFVTHVNCSSDLNVFSSSNSDNIILTDGTCTYNSISSRYLQGDSAFVFGAAGATATSCYEYIDSSAASGYFARSTGAYGALRYGNLTLSGTAQSIDP
ncbi:MAG: hypothetical protein LLG04_04135, partial [Parachlamydia sp.]|nr:hypothetical protein [Parachlamydia sp.]